MASRVSILGSTGSIGRQALDVVRQGPGDFVVEALAAHSNAALLIEQALEFKPRLVAVSHAPSAAAVRDALPGVEVIVGPDAPSEAAARHADTVLCAMVGAAGIRPILAAIAAGNTVAIANKEPLVMGGRIIMEAARSAGVNVLPVDSEHNAIFQCLMGHPLESVHCIHLTASGGPFYRKSREELRHVTPEQAARHPNWDMGVKISCDSATLMNKGLEVIEAMWLFDLPLEKIEVIIHPQSIVHSMVEFTDGGILAHLGPTNMRFPIQFALTWPNRVQSPLGRLDLANMRELTFAAPDFTEFPCLAYALEAARIGGTAPAILNAANETAVAAFCAKRIEFLDIGAVVRAVLDSVEFRTDDALETVLAADAEARREAERRIAQGKVVSL